MFQNQNSVPEAFAATCFFSCNWVAEGPALRSEENTHSHKVEGYNDTMPMKLQLMEKLLEYHAIQQANWQPSHERYIQAQFATCQSCWSLWIGVMSPWSVPKIWEPVKCFKKGLSIHSNLCTVCISNSFLVQFYWQPKTRSNSDIFWPYESTELK